MDNTKQHDVGAEAVDPRYPGTPIGIVRSRDAFLRDLPALLANPKYDRWCAAYVGDERIGMAECELDLLRLCQRRGLRRDQYFIGTIFPHGEDNEEIEYGYVEFDEIDDEYADEPPNSPKPIP